MTRIILASASPRRKELLSQAGYQFTVVKPRINEKDLRSEKAAPAEYAKKAALAKAMDVAQRHPDSLVIGADTVADFNGRIIGKPLDAKDAELIIRLLFGAPHKVITALAIVRICDRTEIVETDITIIFPKKLSEKEITEHIRAGSWRDKAGAYAIRQHADPFIERIEGSLTNVMGLPMELLEKLLKKITD
jgi:septum formation protein